MSNNCECNPGFLSSDSIKYDGPNTPCVNVRTCDTITTAIQKIDDKICQISGSPFFLTTNGTSGPATYINGILNIPEYGNFLGTVTYVNPLNITSFGTDVTSSVDNPTTAPTITLNLPTASFAARGLLSAADWSLFYNKENAIAPSTINTYWRGDKTFQILDTTAVAEGFNLYFTNARSRSALSFSAGSGNYNPVSGVITIPTDNNQLGNGAGYITTISGIAAGGDLNGTYPNPTLKNASVTGQLLSGVNITGGSVVDTDSILVAFGKLQNQINSLIGGSVYQGLWNASTNTPTITSSVGAQGHYYIVSVAGSTNIDGITDWQIGDWIIFNGSTWGKVDNTDAVISVNGQTGIVSLTTSNIVEGVNLYYTDSRVRAALSSVATGLSYSTSTGEFSLTAGYVIPTTVQETNWNEAYTNRITSLTTTGTSGPATLVGNTLNIPQYQPLLTNPVTGESSSLDNSIAIFDGTTGQKIKDTRLIVTDYDDIDAEVTYISSTVSSFGNGREITIEGADATTGVGGPVFLVAGLPANGDGSNAGIYATRGIGTNKNGGSLLFDFGAGTGTGVNGGIVLSLNSGTGFRRGIIKIDNLSPWPAADKIWQMPNASGTVALTSDITSALTGYIPYTGATSNVDLGIRTITAKTFILPASGNAISTDGSSMYIKAGNGNVYIGRDNVVKIEPDGKLAALSFIKSGGTSAQFLKADGSVDSNTYVTTSALSGYLPLAGGLMTGNVVYKNAAGSNTVNIGADDGMYGGASDNGGIFIYGNNKFIISTNSTRQVAVDGSGNMGIGTQSPTYKLDVVGTGNFSGALSGTSLSMSGGANLATSSGNVGIGTSSPRINTEIFTVGSSFTSSTYTINFVTTKGLLLSNSAGTSESGNGIWFDNSGLFAGLSSTRVSTGTWGTDLRFYTHPDLTTNQYDVTERMRITSGGNVLIKTTTDNGTDALQVAGSGLFTVAAKVGSTQGFVRLNAGNSISSGFVEFFKGDNTTRLGYIGYSNTNIDYVAENSAIHNFTGAATFSSSVTAGGEVVGTRFGGTSSATSYFNGAVEHLNGTLQYWYNAGSTVYFSAQNNAGTWQMKYNGGSPILSVSSTGAATFSSLAGTGDRFVVANSSGQLSATALSLSSSSYSPTISASTNLSYSNWFQATYVRVGNVTTVYIGGTITMTSANTATSITITLPINATASVSQSYIGNGTVNTTFGGLSVSGFCNISSLDNTKVTFNFTSPASGDARYAFSFQYLN